MANNLTPKEEFLLNPVTEHNITDAAIATFETNFRHPVKVEIPFEPVQDLHGMDHPYPAGASVNLISDGTDISNGYVSGYYLKDDNTTVSGTNWYVSEYFPVDPSITYTLSTRTASTAPSICFYDSEKTFISGFAFNQVLSHTFKPPENAAYARSSQVTYAYQATNPTGQAIQLEVGSTATEYRRYSNVCPITGINKADVMHTSKNILDDYVLTFNGTLSAPKGLWIANGGVVNATYGDCCVVNNYIDCSEYIGQTLRLNYRPASSASEHESQSAGVAFYNSNHQFISGIANGYNNGGPWAFTVPNNPEIKYLRLSVQYTKRNELMLVARSDYLTYPIVFTDPTTGNLMTVYGGTVTLNEDGSADLVVTHGAKPISDWKYYTIRKQNPAAGWDSFQLYLLAADISTTDGAIVDGKPNIWSSEFVAVANSVTNPDYSIRKANVYIYLAVPENTYANWDEFKTALADVPIVYPLATPLTYHFPNVGQLKTFLGENNIWSDIGNVNVKYLTQNSETGMEYRGDRALELRRRAMLADAPTIHTTTGSEETGGLASFKSYVKAPVKKIEIPFKPKQDLHGYDHPWPAGGWKNLFNKDGIFVDHIVIKAETAYKLASGTGSAISTVTPGTTVLLNETIDGATKAKPWIYLGLDESGNARLYREKADDEPRQMDATTSNVSYDGCDMDQYLVDETSGFLSRFDSATLAALVSTSIKYVDYFATEDNTASIQTISRKCFLPSYSEMGYGDDPVGNEGQSYLAALKTYYENNTDNTVRIGKTEERTAYKIWLRSGQGTANSRYRNIVTNGQISYDNVNTATIYVRPMISLDPNTVVETVDFGKDTLIQNTTLYTDPITVSPSTAYTLSGRCYTNQIMRVDEYDANDNFLRSTVSTAMNHPSISFTTTENTAYVLINPDWVIQFVQLEAGSAATSYAPYSNICPIEGYSDGISYFESKKANIYGARWDRLQHRLTRYGAAEDFDTDVTNFRINGEVSSSYDNPFDALYPWSERKLCNINLTQYMALQNGSSITDCVTYWEGETGFSYDDPDGVWVYTPKFWGRSYDDANGHRCFEVADRPVYDFIEYDEQITARWRGVVETREIDGVSKQVLLPTLGNPGRYTLVNTLHTYAKNYGGSITSIYSIDPSYLLMIVEFASMNPRLDVGGGVNSLYRQNVADKIAENATDSIVIKLPNSYAVGMIPDALIDIGTANGGNQIGSRWIVSAELDENTNLWTVTLNEPITVTTANFWSIHGMANRPDAAIGSKSGYLGENNRSHAYYRGEELWGNFWMYVIGVYKSARDEVWLCPKNLDPDDYNALNTSVHVNTGVQLSMANGFSREFGYPKKSFGLSAPALSVLNGGNATDPSGSQFYTSARNARILFVGGDASDGTAVGFSWNWYFASSYSNWNYGASPRLKNPPRGLSGGPQSP